MRTARPDLSYYAIMFGGVPMTDAGRERFVKAAIVLGGYNLEEIKKEGWLK